MIYIHDAMNASRVEKDVCRTRKQSTTYTSYKNIFSFTHECQFCKRLHQIKYVF